MKRFVTVFAMAIAAMAWAGSPALAAPAATTDPSLSLAANAAFLSANAQKPRVIVRPDGLQYKIIQNGFGEHPQPTDTVEVYYTGSLINGEVFDGTSPGLPTSFKVNGVIPGWSEALQLMRVGDHWQLVIPASLAYGARGAGSAVPPNQTLIFDVKLLKTTPAPQKGQKGYVPDPNDLDADGNPQ